MAGTRAGWQKAKIRLLERYGGPEGLKKHYQELGKEGGQISRGGGFAKMDPKKHFEASSRGGRHRRG